MSKNQIIFNHKYLIISYLNCLCTMSSEDTSQGNTAAAVLGLVPLGIGLSIDFVSLFTEFNPHIHTGSDSAAFWNILAWTIIYGLTFSTILTLVIVPCMYYINERIRDKWFRKNKTAKVEEMELVEN